MVDQLYSEIIGVISISSPPEYNSTIYRYDQLAFVLQKLEEEEMHNLEEEEQMITRDGELATIIQ